MAVMTRVTRVIPVSDGIDISDVEVVGRDKAEVTDSVILRGPPGTGKTMQCSARLYRLLTEHDINLGEVAWATYRVSLARDTIKRLVKKEVVSKAETEKPKRGATRYIGTYHAVGLRRLLDALPGSALAEYGVDPSDPDDELKVADLRDKIAFCNHRDLRFKTEHPWEQSPGKLIFRTWEWLQNNLLDPSDPDDIRECQYVDQLRDEHDFQGSLTRLWADWQRFKQHRGKIDYAQMLSECLRHGIGLPGQKVLIIDEFHDCTPLMTRLGQQWAEDVETVIVAGDQDQIVNAYDGPSRELFHRIRRELDLPEVLLDHSYRVPNKHWVAATRMLEEAHSPPPVSRDPGGVVLQHPSPTFTPSDESDVWGDVPQPDAEFSPVDLYRRTRGDIMYLARARVQVAGINYALDRAGIIYESQQDMGGWFDHDDRLPLFDGLQKLRKVNVEASLTVGANAGLHQYTGASGEKPMDAITLSPEETDRLLYYTPAKKYLAKTRPEIDDLREQITDEELAVPLTEFVEWVEPEFWGVMTQGPAAVAKMNDRNLDKQDRVALMNALKRYDDTVDRGDVRATVQTIHASKGGESHHVCVYDGVTRRIKDNMDADVAAKQNEYRTWYVAMTRSSEFLHILRGGFPELTETNIIPNDIMSTVRRRTDDADDRGGAAGDD